MLSMSLSVSLTIISKFTHSLSLLLFLFLSVSSSHASKTCDNIFVYLVYVYNSSKFPPVEIFFSDCLFLPQKRRDVYQGETPSLFS